MVYGNPGVAVFDGQVHSFRNRACILYRCHVGAVGHDFGDRGVVKLKNIGDHILGAVLNHALLLADIHHHQDFLLSDGFLRGVGINPQQPEHKVCRHG